MSDERKIYEQVGDAMFFLPNYAYDNHCTNKGIKEKIANAKPSSSLFSELTENMTEEEILETMAQAKARARLYEWLGSFNTDSATECFTAVQELKKRLDGDAND